MCNAQSLSFFGGYGYTITGNEFSKQTGVSRIVGLNREGLIPFSTFTYNIGLTYNRNYYSKQNLSGNSSFITDKFLLIPISLIKNLQLNQKNSIYIELGLGFNYHFLQIEETVLANSPITYKQKNLGIGLGTLFNFGYKSQITEKLMLHAGLKNLEINNIFSNYKNDLQKIKASNILLEFGFSKTL